MKYEYFTDYTEIIVYWAIFVAICLALIMVIPDPILFIWLISAGTTVFCIISVARMYFPVIENNELYVKNAVLRYRFRKYGLASLDLVHVYFGYYKIICIKLRVKGETKWHYYALSSMGYQSIRPFVEELRSKGVEVKCPPYKYKGKMIYL